MHFIYLFYFILKNILQPRINVHDRKINLCVLFIMQDIFKISSMLYISGESFPIFPKTNILAYLLRRLTQKTTKKNPKNWRYNRTGTSLGNFLLHLHPLSTKSQ